jgi:dynein heavy chain
LEELLMQIFRKRAAATKQWLQQSIRALTGMVIKIEEFVEQKNAVDRIARELPFKREDIEVASGLLALMIECQILSIKKEDRELSQELNFLEGSLNVALSEADNNTAKNIDRFKKTLKERIEKLKTESVELNESVMREKFLLLTTA